MTGIKYLYLNNLELFLLKLRNYLNIDPLLETSDTESRKIIKNSNVTYLYRWLHFG